MQERGGMKVSNFVRPLGMLVAFAVAGCAADSTVVADLMVVPGYFDTLECPELANQFQAASQRVNELTMLREKAAGEPAGAFANAVAYNAEYTKAQATKKYSQDAANRKGCDLTKKAAVGAKPAPNRLDWASPVR
jgi:hypothetical protein